MSQRLLNRTHNCFARFIYHKLYQFSPTFGSNGGPALPQTLTEIVNLHSTNSSTIPSDCLIKLILDLLIQSSILYTEGCTPSLTADKVRVSRDYTAILEYTRTQCDEESIVAGILDIVNKLSCCMPEKDLAFLHNLCTTDTHTTLRELTRLLSNYHTSSKLRPPGTGRSGSGKDSHLLSGAELDLSNYGDVYGPVTSFSRIPFIVDLPPDSPSQFTTSTVKDLPGQTDKAVYSRAERTSANQEETVVPITPMLNANNANLEISSDSVSDSSSSDTFPRRRTPPSKANLPLADSKHFPRAVSTKSQTPLMIATCNRDLKAMNQCIKFANYATDKELELDINGEKVVFLAGTTALMIAARMGFLEGVKKLLCEVRLRNARSEMAIMLATVGGHISCIQELMPYEVRSKDNYGRSSLMLATKANNIDAVRLLCSSEAGMISHKRMFALMIAAGKNYVEIVKILAPKEAGMLNARKETALLTALSKGFVEVATILAPFEGDIPDSNGKTPIERAYKCKNICSDNQLWENCIRALMLNEGQNVKNKVSTS